MTYPKGWIGSLPLCHLIFFCFQRVYRRFIKSVAADAKGAVHLEYTDCGKRKGRQRQFDSPTGEGAGGGEREGYSLTLSI